MNDVLVDAATRQLLAGQIARGECVLFTGAGFSHGARSTDGQPVPQARALAQLLWPIAFPSEEFDEDSSLADVYDCAVQASEQRTVALMKSALSVDANTLPSHFETWFKVPWKRVYTLNIDDLEAAIQRLHSLPVRMRSFSAVSGSPTVSGSDLEYVHLNGSLADVPNVTFAAPQYGSRLPGRDPWYPNLVADLMGSPVVFVGTSLEESPLWQHLALRGTRADLDRELRPRSYLVSPSLPPARQRLLRSFNIDYIPMTAEQFATDVLESLRESMSKGHLVLSERRNPRRKTEPFRRVSELRNEKCAAPLADFLLGREPTWQDVTEGFAFTREFEAELLGDPSFLDPRAVLITGTAGSGKSTTLLRLCLELQASGQDVAFLDTDTELSLPNLRQALRSDTPDILAIDDVDFMGAQAAPFICEVLDENPDLRVLATSRSTRAERVGLRDGLLKLDTKFVSVPHLVDSDIDDLLSALDRAKRPGQLKGLSKAEQRKLVREQASRQLLVAMIQVTSGRQFDERVDEECRDLPSGEALLYVIAALATRARAWLSADELLLAAGGARADTLKHLDALRRKHLLVELESGHLTVRHRVIAERVVAHYRHEHRLTDAVEGILFAMATKAGTHSRTTREGKLLIRLLNHSFMVQELGDLAAARRVYASLESLLAMDAHYWLQRGSLEVEVGDLEQAENFLNQAKGLSPDDYQVQTEWAYMRLKRAADDAAGGHPAWKEKADEAMTELRDAIERRGRTDSYPFHVLGSQGLGYSRRAPLTPSEREVLLNDLRGVLQQGCRLHPGNADLIQLRDDLEAEYLRLSLGETKSEQPPAGE